MNSKILGDEMQRNEPMRLLYHHQYCKECKKGSLLENQETNASELNAILTS